jgi:hypothetical protein
VTYALPAMRAIPSVAHWTQALAAVAVVGLFFAIHPDGFQTLAIWSHNSFSFWAGTLLSLRLVLVVRRPKPPTLPTSGLTTHSKPISRASAPATSTWTSGAQWSGQVLAPRHCATHATGTSRPIRPFAAELPECLTRRSH